MFPGEQPSAVTTTKQVGVKRVAATAYGNTNTYWPEDRPAAALDGDLATAWRTQGFGNARGQRIQIDLAGPITTDHVNLVQPLYRSPNRYITNAQLTFDGGAPVNVVLDPSSRTPAGQTITFPSRTFHTFSIRIVQTNDHRPTLFGQDDAIGFAEIRVRDAKATHDVRVSEVVQMPSDLLSALGASSSDHPVVIVMSRDAIRPTPPRTQPELSIRREFTLPTARTFDLTGNATVSPDADDAAITDALRPGSITPGLGVSSSGFLPGCLACRAGSAFDDDPTTVWQTPFDQVQGQWAQIDSAEPVTFDHLDLGVLADGKHSVPTRLRLDVDGTTRELTVPNIVDTPKETAPTEVRIAFPAVHGKQIRVTITGIREERTRLFATGHTRVEPVGIAAFGIAPATTRPANTGAVASGCRADLVMIDGKPVPVRITGKVADARSPMGLTVTPCNGALDLGKGPHVLTTDARRRRGLFDRPARARVGNRRHARDCGRGPRPDHSARADRGHGRRRAQRRHQGTRAHHRREQAVLARSR